MRRIRVAVLGLCLAVGLVYVPACEYDANGVPRNGQPGVTVTTDAAPAVPAPAAQAAA